MTQTATDKALWNALMAVAEATIDVVRRTSGRDWLDDDLLALERDNLVAIASTAMYGSPGSPDLECQRLADSSWSLLEPTIRKNRLQAVATAVRALADRVEAATSAYVPLVEPPAPQPFGVSFAGAEALCVQWMRHLGVRDAEVTRFSGDGGVDVTSATHVAQVKVYASPVGVAPLRELFGVASVLGRRAVFFASRGYTAGAVSFAEQAGVLAFTFRAEDGTLVGDTPAARHARTYGLG